MQLCQSVEEEGLPAVIEAWLKAHPVRHARQFGPLPEGWALPVMEALGDLQALGASVVLCKFKLGSLRLRVRVEDLGHAPRAALIERCIARAARRCACTCVQCGRAIAAAGDAIDGTWCDTCRRNPLQHGRMQNISHGEQEGAVATVELSLAAVAGSTLPDCLAQLPEPWRIAAQGLVEAAWAMPVASLRWHRGRRSWWLANLPGDALDPGGACFHLDEGDVLHLAAAGWPRKADLVDLAELSRCLADWSQRRCNFWFNQASRSSLPRGFQQACTQWVAPLERRLRDAVIQAIWQHSLQGAILPEPAFATGHAMTLPLVRWIVAARHAGERRLRRDLVMRGRGAVALLLARPTPRVARALRTLCRGPSRLGVRRMAAVMAPWLGLPAWTVRRVMTMAWQADVVPAETTLEELRRLSRHLPPSAWPRDRSALEGARRCLKALDGVLCFGFFDCERWPADQPLPAAVRRWLLRELRVCHGSDWQRFAMALEGDEPRYQLLASMLGELSRQYWAVQCDAPDAMERQSAPWRAASPEWWMERLPRWWSRVTKRHGEPAVSAVAWRPLFDGTQVHGARRVRCLGTSREVQRLLTRHGARHLLPWVGPSLIGRTQWLLFEFVDGGESCSLLLLHAAIDRTRLQVEAIAHLPLAGGQDLTPECSGALHAFWAAWEARHWGVLARVEDEAVLEEDEDLCAAIQRSRVRVWQAVTRMKR